MAELACEYITFVVREGSPFTSLSDFVDKIKADPASVNIGGSSSGSIEHVVMGTLAEAIGVDPTELNYVPYESGGEQTTSLLSGDTDITITGISETRGWDYTFKGGKEFETHLQSESDRMEQALKSLGLIDG